MPFIKDVIFNDPATIVYWNDGTKTVVKCAYGDKFDSSKGLTMAISKKYLGSNKELKKWLPEKEKKNMDILSDLYPISNLILEHFNGKGE